MNDDTFYKCTLNIARWFRTFGGDLCTFPPYHVPEPTPLPMTQFISIIQNATDIINLDKLTKYVHKSLKMLKWFGNLDYNENHIWINENLETFDIFFKILAKETIARGSTSVSDEDVMIPFDVGNLYVFTRIESVEELLAIAERKNLIIRTKYKPELRNTMEKYATSPDPLRNLQGWTKRPLCTNQLLIPKIEKEYGINLRDGQIFRKEDGKRYDIRYEPDTMKPFRAYVLSLIN
jgi:hypothetical protein